MVVTLVIGTVSGVYSAFGGGETGAHGGAGIRLKTVSSRVATLDSVVLKPRSFTFEQAAGIPVAGIAGYRAAAEAGMVLNMVDNQAGAGMGYLRRGGTFSLIASDAGGGEVPGG